MIRDWLDNPLFIKHARARLRTPALITGVAIVLLLCLCIIYGGFQTKTLASGEAFTMLLVLQAILLGVIGSTQVAAAIGSAKASGILDFHRISPQSPLELTLGFFFGAPIREYVLTAVTIPFLLFCSMFGYPELPGLLQAELLLICVVWTLHALALLGGLVMKGTVASSSAMGFAVMISILTMGPMFGAFYQFNRMIVGEARLELFGVSLPWLAVVILYLATLLCFLMLGATRKMESPRLPSLSKAQTLGAACAAGLLTVGGMSNWDAEAEGFLFALYALVILGVFLIALTAVDQLDYVRALRRSKRENASRLSIWSDFAPNWWIVMMICGVLLVTATILGSKLNNPQPSFPQGFSSTLPIVVGILTIAYFGLAAQFFKLRFGRVGTGLFGLFLFIAWGLPMIIGVIFLASSGGPGTEQNATLAFSASPIVGITAAAGSFENDAGTGPAYIAVTLSLLYAFVFNGLYAKAARRVRRAVERVDGPGEKADLDFLDSPSKPAAAAG